MSAHYWPAGQTPASTPATNPTPSQPPAQDMMGLSGYMPSKGVNVYPHDMFAYAGFTMIGLAAGITAGKGFVKLIKSISG